MYFNKFDIETTNSQIENIEILERIICTDKLPWFSFSFDFRNKPFFGIITDNLFDISPVIKGRNSFVPVLKGEVTNDFKSTVKVKMRLHLLVILFLLFITTLILYSLLTDLNNGGLIILPIAYGLITYEYLKQSKKYKIEFEKHFK
jgi:hypothetical protein